MVHAPPESLILHGALIASFSDDESFEFCQANSTLRIKRNTQGALIIMTLAGFVASAQRGEIFAQLR